MAKTFNIDLWEYLRTFYTNTLSSTLKGKAIYFEEAKATQKAPYCVLHVLDFGTDEDSQTLCKNDEGYNKVGTAQIQFSIYATNGMLIDELLAELNDVIESLSNLNLYRINTTVRDTTFNTKGEFSSEVGVGITRYTFTYESL